MVAKKKKTNKKTELADSKKKSTLTSSKTKRIKSDTVKVNKKKVNKVQKSVSNHKKEKKTDKELKKCSIKKYVFLIFVVLLSLTIFIQAAYGLFRYMRKGTANGFVVGDIYMNYVSEENLGINLMEPRSNLDDDTYIEFNVTGMNEDDQSIWYGIDLFHGDVPTQNEETNRIKDELLRFTLVKSVNNGEEVPVLSNQCYEDIQNLRIYVETIPGNTVNSLIHSYKLYVWVTDEIKVGNTVDADYSLSEWNDLFASIKVRVVGDFMAKGAYNSIRVLFDGNGGTVSVPYKFYEEGDRYGELPTATREGYAFEGWRAANDVKVHSNKELQYNESHTLTAVWSIVKYSHAGEYTFDGTNYINTGVDLFTEANAWRNFYISFDIVKVDSNNSTSGTIINSQMISDPKYGFVFNRNGSSNQFRMISNGNVKTYTRNNIYYGPQNVKIIRINDIIYYSLNGGGFTKSGDYTGFSSYFDNPVVFGATLTSGGSAQSFFKGKLANMLIKIIVGDDVSLDDYLYSTDSFEYDGDIVFNGSTAINTGVYLFSRENVTRDFYMSFDIKNINWGSTSQSTLMSSKDESGTPWPGFELRRSGSSNVYLQSKATFGTGKNNDASKIPVSTSNIRFLRVNNVLYYSLDGQDFQLHYDFTGFDLYFDVPVVFGNAFNVETQRYFKGTLANMVVKFIDREEALSVCGSTCSS